MFYMPKIKRTTRNPHALSAKQRLVIQDIVHDVEQGKPIDAVKSTQLAYSKAKHKTVIAMSSKNMNKDDFRNALVESLGRSKIIGKNSLISKKLTEGLDAVTTGKFGGEVDYNTRLRYIQEINKITGVYAPERSEKKTLNLHVDMSSEELDNKIKELQAELSGD